MILVDWQIKNYVKDNEIGISPFSKQQVNPNSYDLILSPSFQITRLTPEIDPYDETSIKTAYEEINVPFWWIKPGGFILGSSIEKITLPPYIVGVVKGKSSLARLGLSIEDAGWIDSGFSGQITFEIKNNNESRIKLYAGMPFAQIVFFSTSNAQKTYSGKYQNQEGATLSRYHENGQRRGY